MPSPRIFISSTYYDLKHVREIVRDFIQNMGYEPVLSEFSDIFYQPNETVQNSCLKEINNCDLFVIIIGKRYGSYFPGDKLSITHKEYLEAQAISIPIYAFIDLDVLHDYEFYLHNQRSIECKYRVVKDTNIFNLIEEIKNATKDNSLIQFSSIDQILSHLKKQWAQLLKSYLQSQKIEAKPKKIIDTEKISDFINRLSIIGINNITEDDIIKSSSFIELITNLNGKVTENETDYKIEYNKNILNIGKSVLIILNDEMSKIKEENDG